MSLDQLYGLCGVLNIPFVVIVQSHLLRDKGSVRLRPIFDSGGSEEFVPLTALAGEILDRLDLIAESSSIQRVQYVNLQDREASGAVANREIASNTTNPAKVECIYVDSEQYIGLDKVKHESVRAKSTLKALKTATQRAEAYIGELFVGNSTNGTPVLAVDLPFRILREYGTCLMDCGNNTAHARDEISQRFPKHKRVVKTLSSAIDSVLRRRGMTTEKKSKSTEEGLQPISMFMYSSPDDRFDLVSIISGGSSKTNGSTGREEPKSNPEGGAGSNWKRSNRRDRAPSR